MTGHPEGAADRFSVGVHSPLRETATVQTSLSVQRWDAEQTEWIARKYERDWGGLPDRTDFAFTPLHFGQYGVRPYSETLDENCNMIVQQGWVWLLGGVAGTTMGTKFSAANGRIGVGTSSTAAAYTQTYLQGDTGSASTTSYYQLVSGAPGDQYGLHPADAGVLRVVRDRRRELRMAGVRDRQRQRVRRVPQRTGRRIPAVQPGCIEPRY